MLNHEEIKALIIAIGAGLGEDFDVAKLRYHRIIIMTDADDDGAHIRTLLLTFFYRHMHPLVSQGYLYIAQPPLYKVSGARASRWAYNEKERERYVKEFTRNGSAKTRVNIQRYKGLGEMSAIQLWETTMDPEKRTLLQVEEHEGAQADELFSASHGRRRPAAPRVHRRARTRSRDRRLGADLVRTV